LCYQNSIPNGISVPEVRIQFKLFQKYKFKKRDSSALKWFHAKIAKKKNAKAAEEKEKRI